MRLNEHIQTKQLVQNRLLFNLGDVLIVVGMQQEATSHAIHLWYDYYNPFLSPRCLSNCLRAATLGTLNVRVRARPTLNVNRRPK